MRRALSAMPIAAQMPWPSEPVATSTNGRRGVGWPSRSEPISRSFSSSARSNAPASAHAAYRIGAACPFDSTKRSLSGLCGSFGSNRISAKKSAATRSAAEQQLVGCPLPASDVDADRVDPQPRGDVLQRGNERRAVNVHNGARDSIVRPCSQFAQREAVRGRRPTACPRARAPTRPPACARRRAR